MKKKKNSSRRSHKTTSNVRKFTRSVIKSNRFQFFCKLLRKYARKIRKRNMIKLENIKHIVFQFYLFFSYIFGLIFSSRTEKTETEQINLNNDYCEKKDNEFLKKLPNFTSTFKDGGEISSDDFNENSDNNEMATTREDFDSSNEEWSNANDVMTKEEITKQNNFFHDKRNDHSFNDFSITSRLKQDKSKGLKRKALTEFTVNVFDKEKTESHIEHKNDSELREEKCNFLQNDSTKCKSYSRRLERKLKWKNIKYKKTTQTGNSDSSDDDNVTLPIKAKRFKKPRFHKNLINKAIRQSEDENTDKELNYMADNENSLDGVLEIIDERISIFKTSFSINSRFEKRASEISSVNIITERLTLPDRINSSPRCSRSPPSFPELPQNPSLTNYNFDSQLWSSSNNNPISSRPRSMAIPPAPSPMRHLYYQYPEFMDLPNTYANSSNDITSNDINNINF